jgi:hypothetical protein
MMVSDKNSTVPDPTFCLSIAGKSIGLYIDDESLAEYIKNKYLVYLTNDIPQSHISLFWRECSVDPPLTLPRTIFESEKITISSDGAKGYYDFNNRIGELSVSLKNPQIIIENYLRLIYAITIFSSGGLLLHSAGIIRKERAYIFFGHSGSGKTTISRISKKSTVLSDDLVILLPSSNHWVAHATPFWNPIEGQFVHTSASINGLYHLVQDRKVFKVKLSKSKALAELLSNVPIIPLFPEMNNRLLERGLNIINSLPIYALHFLPDSSFWDVIDE